jgi:peptidoglycan-N-acetylglucosamine deacetylase
VWRVVVMRDGCAGCGGGLVGLAGAGCGVMLVASAAWHVGPAVTWLPLVRRFLPGLAGRGRGDHVAVTFDDGPGLGSTPAVLAALEAVDVRATFFVLGAALARHRELGRVMCAAGHELAVHGWDHRWLCQGTVGLPFGRTVDLPAGGQFMSLSAVS